MVREASPSLLLSRAQGDELDLLAAQLDLELIAGLQAQLGGAGLADEQVAVELDLGVEAQAAARPPANSGGGKPRSQRLEAALLDPPPGRSPVLIGRPVGPLDRPRWQRINEKGGSVYLEDSQLFG